MAVLLGRSWVGYYRRCETCQWESCPAVFSLEHVRRRETWLVSKGVFEHVHVRYFAHFFVLKAFVSPFRNDRSKGPGNGRAPGQGEKQNVSVTQRASLTHININFVVIATLTVGDFPGLDGPLSFCSHSAKHSR